MNERGPVVFALFEGAHPTRSVERALALARVLDCELVVVQVIERVGGSVAGLFSLDALAKTKPGARRVEQDTRAWLAKMVGGERAAKNLCIRVGDFVKQAAARAVELNALLIVMAPREGSLGATATALANAAKVPILVAREAMADDAIIAATDLEDVAYPVLRDAAQLGQRLGAQVIALHNLNPVSVFSALDLALSSAAGFGQALSNLKRHRLERVLRQLPGQPIAVLADEADPVEAILLEVKGRNADVVVVGTGPCPRERGKPSRVPERVIDRARCSVLIVPLDRVGPSSSSLLWA